MLTRLHARATTTPAVRAAIQASTDNPAVLAKRHGIAWETAEKWQSRAATGEVHDRSHTAHRLQTTLTEAQGAIVVHLRKTLQLPLDDLLLVTQEFISAAASRSAIDRLLRRHGVSRLDKAVEAKDSSKPAWKPFKAYEPGFVHVDVKYLPKMIDQDRRQYLFVAIDRATRWVHIACYDEKTAANAERFLKDLHEACPVKITRLLTDNGTEFTDRLFGRNPKDPSGQHEFDQLCTALGIEHRLTKPRTPQTNGMVERFNGRISEVLATNRFEDGEDLRSALTRYVWLYNCQLPQKALDYKPPIEALKKWFAEKPQLFHRQPRHRQGLDT